MVSKLSMSLLFNQGSANLRRGVDLDVFAGFDSTDRASPDGAKTKMLNSRKCKRLFGRLKRESSSRQTSAGWYSKSEATK